jgi:arsenate reductase (thioredoxin)
MTAHWGVPDPAAVTDSEDAAKAAFFEAFRQLNNRIGIFINLSMERLDRMSLQHQLEEIGRA